MAQAVLLTAFSIVFIGLHSTDDASEIYALAALLIFNLIALTLATYVNIAEFSFHTFSKDRRSKTGKFDTVLNL